MTFTVPGYRIEGLLGCGSQGQVWAARSIEDGEPVAIKRITARSAAAADSARSEAALLAVLDHPNLIALRGYLVVQSDIALVLELAGAGSLAELLRRRHRLAPAEVVATISPIAAALAHAHDSGILHADVSAANILFTDTGQPKLADLGVARLLAGGGEAIGTPAYLDPAVAAGGAPGAASDVFALAAVALHALTGTGPWQRPGDPALGAEQVLAVAATGRVVELPGRLADLVTRHGGAASPELAAVLVRALDPDPVRRGTAAELALDLRAALRPEPVMLTGGRIPATVGRHSVELRQQRAAAAAEAAAARWPGSAEQPAEPARLAADLTHVSRRPPPRPAAEPAVTPHRWLRWPAAGSRLTAGARLAARARSAARARPRGVRPLLARWRAPNVLPAAAVLAVVGVAATLVVVAGLLGHRQGAASAAVRPAPASGSTTSAPAPATVRPGRATDSPAPGAAPDPAAILAGLDRLRAEAYAQRRPELLARVYRSASLLAQDTAQLTGTVPAGCQLAGLSTDYRQLAVIAGRGRLQVQVTARLAAGTLYCAGTIRRRTPAVGPVRLLLSLAGTPTGYLLDGERLLGPGT